MAIQSSTNYSLTGEQITELVSNIKGKANSADVLPITTKYGATFEASINNTTYVMTLTLKDQNGNTLGTAQTIDLPLETVVVNGSYSDKDKKIILTLQSGSTIDIPVADLVAGLQAEITTTNKLSADLVDDASTTNKFATSAQLSKLDSTPTITTIGNNLTLSNGTLSATNTVYTLPPATTSVLGGVIVGSGLSVSANGTISANSQSSTISSSDWTALWA